MLEKIVTDMWGRKIRINDWEKFLDDAEKTKKENLRIFDILYSQEKERIKSPPQKRQYNSSGFPIDEDGNIIGPAEMPPRFLTYSPGNRKIIKVDKISNETKKEN